MLGNIQTWRPGLKPFAGQTPLLCSTRCTAGEVPAVLSPYFFPSGSSITEAVIPTFMLIPILCKNDNWEATPCPNHQGQPVAALVSSVLAVQLEEP